MKRAWLKDRVGCFWGESAHDCNLTIYVYIIYFGSRRYHWLHIYTHKYIKKRTFLFALIFTIFLRSSEIDKQVRTTCARQKKNQYVKIFIMSTMTFDGAVLGLVSQGDGLRRKCALMVRHMVELTTFEVIAHRDNFNWCLSILNQFR